MVDFKRKGHTHGAIQILSEAVEIVYSNKYLGTIFEDTLIWDLNTEAINKKGHQRLRLLRELRFLTLIQLSLSCFITILLRAY